MKRSSRADDTFAVESSDCASSGDDTEESDTGDIGSRRKMVKQHRKENGRLRLALGDEALIGGDASTSPKAAVESSSSSDDEEEDALPDELPEDVPAAPSTTAPHLLVLLDVMRPNESVAGCIARVAKARDSATDPAQRALEAAKLDKTMSAAQELELLVRGVQDESRDQLAVRAFKAIRKRLPKAYVLWWGQIAPAGGWESVPAENWYGLFQPEQMELWRKADVFHKKSCFVRNVNAIPREIPKLATDVTTFV